MSITKRTTRKWQHKLRRRKITADIVETRISLTCCRYGVSYRSLCHSCCICNIEIYGQCLSGGCRRPGAATVSANSTNTRPPADHHDRHSGHDNVRQRAMRPVAIMVNSSAWLIKQNFLESWWGRVFLNLLTTFEFFRTFLILFMSLQPWVVFTWVVAWLGPSKLCKLKISNACFRYDKAVQRKVAA